MKGAENSAPSSYFGLFCESAALFSGTQEQVSVFVPSCVQVAGVVTVLQVWVWVVSPEGGFCVPSPPSDTTETSDWVVSAANAGTDMAMNSKMLNIRQTSFLMISLLSIC